MYLRLQQIDRYLFLEFTLEPHLTTTSVQTGETSIVKRETNSIQNRDKKLSVTTVS